MSGRHLLPSIQDTSWVKRASLWNKQLSFLFLQVRSWKQTDYLSFCCKNIIRLKKKSHANEHISSCLASPVLPQESVCALERTWPGWNCFSSSPPSCSTLLSPCPLDKLGWITATESLWHRNHMKSAWLHVKITSDFTELKLYCRFPTGAILDLTSCSHSSLIVFYTVLLLCKCFHTIEVIFFFHGFSARISFCKFWATFRIKNVYQISISISKCSASSGHSS